MARMSALMARFRDDPPSSLAGLKVVRVRDYQALTSLVPGGQPPQQVFDYSGLRVTPNVYTTLQELDTFVEAMQEVLKKGIPAATATRRSGD